MTRSNVHDNIKELSPVCPTNIFKCGGKPPVSRPLLLQSGLANGTRVGPIAGELDGFEAAENGHQRRERARRGTVEVRPFFRPLLRFSSHPSWGGMRCILVELWPASTCSYGPVPCYGDAAQYTFQHIQPLPHLPDRSAARALLAWLAADPAIVHVMHTHRLSVGFLTELAQHEQPHLLGST
ncbi:uncharacterized protein BXZ73DRAFT_106907 [Epithele typhae]|uniref:uncharacterized protein n=1 Tax=Epithele typhae TaxID=378194 RepID=UPI0020089446|nr:uncharacterized protein BXZ73DRAFT_106907 [Epithele typhae]KAH9913566.1 hypothetical protein BXZ73DRAFT_106907 [Epithele typhae]